MNPVTGCIRRRFGSGRNQNRSTQNRTVGAYYQRQVRRTGCFKVLSSKVKTLGAFCKKIFRCRVKTSENTTMLPLVVSYLMFVLIRLI